MDGVAVFWVSMLVLVGLIIGAVALADKSATVEASDFSVSCIDGVEYWYGQSGYKGYMSPRINSETLDFVRCE